MNIELKRKPRTEPTLQELDQTPFSKYKYLVFKTSNFLEITNRDFLMENCLYELETAYGVLNSKPQEKELYFKQAENSNIIKELAKLAELTSNFVLTEGRIKYNNAEDECDHEAFNITIQDGKVTVLV